MLLYSVYTGQTMGSTLLKHQRRGSPKEICDSLHACNGIPCPKHYTPIRKFETIFMSRLVMHCTSFLIVIYALQVLRNTTMMQKETTSLAIDGMHQLTLWWQSTGWRCCRNIVEKRGRILSGTLLTGMKVELRPSKLNVEKQYKGQQSLYVAQCCNNSWTISTDI